jgi:hypothetical protein
LQSCKNESWVGIAKYLMHDVSLLLKSVDATDIQKVLSVIFTSLPPNFGEFIKWVAEVRRREDGDESSRFEKLIPPIPILPLPLPTARESSKQEKKWRVLWYFEDQISPTQAGKNQYILFNEQYSISVLHT